MKCGFKFGIDTGIVACHEPELGKAVGIININTILVIMILRTLLKLNVKMKNLVLQDLYREK